MSTTDEPTVRVWSEDGVGVVVLNRPRALNALDETMVEVMHRSLEQWAEDDAIRAVWVYGAGEKGLCAGGDIRVVREAVRNGQTETAMRFFAGEYALNRLVAGYPKPYVAWMDGVVMGGGVGISGHGSHRLVTERTRVAMPETIIGFFPDVGALWLLSRAPGELGTHVALTGTTIGGADALALGLADAAVPSTSRDEVFAELKAAVGDDATLESWRPGSADAEEAEGSTLAQQRGWVDECYRGSDATAILRRLRASQEPAADEAADMIEARSPHSVAVTLEALRRARELSIEQVLDQDLTVARTVIAHPDFDEGVRAQLVDKDRSPRWSPSHVRDVARDEVLAAFRR